MRRKAFSTLPKLEEIEIVIKAVTGLCRALKLKFLINYKKALRPNHSFDGKMKVLGMVKYLLIHSQSVYLMIIY